MNTKLLELQKQYFERLEVLRARKTKKAREKQADLLRELRVQFADALYETVKPNDTVKLDSAVIVGVFGTGGVGSASGVVRVIDRYCSRIVVDIQGEAWEVPLLERPMGISNLEHERVKVAA